MKFTLLVLLLASWIGLPLFADQPEIEFRVINDPQGTGKALCASWLDQRSARQALKQTLDALNEYLDAPIQTLAAYADTKDGRAQCSIMAKLNDTPIRGIVSCDVLADQHAAVACVFYDRPEMLAESYPRLIKLVQQSAPRAPESLNWQIVRFADGSGSLNLPDGWRLNSANKGMCDISGPEGAAAAFGIALPVNVPGVMPQIPGSERLIWAPLAPPEQAIFLVNQELRRQQGRTGDGNLTLVEVSHVPPPASMTGASAAYLHFTFDRDDPAGAQPPTPMRALAFVITAPTGPGTWLYYFSQIYAPQQVYQRELAVMLEIWKSYRISDRLVQERLNEALESMRQTHEMILQIGQRWDQAREDAHYKWIEVIRDERYMRDTQLDTLHPQSLHYVDKIIEELNRTEGYQRYEVVPLDQLMREQR